MKIRMGLFSRKKKLSKDQRKKLDKAREELQKSKDEIKSYHDDIKKLDEIRKQKLEQQRQKEKENSGSPTKNISISHEYNPDPKQLEEQKKSDYKLKIEKLQRDQKEIEEFNAKVESVIKQKQEEFNNDESNFQSNDSVQENSENNTQTCLVPDCNVQVNFFSGKKCKFCKNLYCFEHIQLEKHECVKSTPTKYLRKTWLRRYGINISSGKFIVVCDDCEYVSGYGSLIDEAGDERKYHIDNSHCNPKQVFLEEDLSEEKVEKNINLEQVVPIDRGFWVCSHCRPAQKFTDRSEYIAHHLSHG